VSADTEISSESVRDSAPLEDENGDVIAGGDANDAFAGYELQRKTSDGSTGSQAYFVRCIVLEPGASVLVIRQYCATELYPLAAVLRDTLLTGLELP
jgi:hypothetical protein